MIVEDLRLNIKLDDSFFNPEEKCGFLVTRKRKELWAVQLDLLNELFRVCKKHNLKVIADGGTLLGAVRHKGFIPWDDDVDLVMLRDDFNKLMELGNKEFKKGYFLQTPYTDNYYLSNHIKFKKDGTTMLERLDKNAKYHCGVFIDIFVNDYIPKNNTILKLRKMKLYKHYRKLVKPKFKKRREQDPFLLTLLKLMWNIFVYPFKKFAYDIYYKKPNIKLKNYKKWDKMCSKYNHKTNLVGSVTFRSQYHWLNKNSKKMYIVHEDDYTNPIELPFENTKILCPRNYDSVLKQQYGDYNCYIFEEALHSNMFVDVYKSYDEYLNLSSEKFDALFDNAL